MKAHQWIVTLGLLALVVAAAVGLILTRQSAQSNSAGSRTRRPPIVDEQPLTTARAMAALASDWDEQRYSRQALKLADHSVDVAFSYEMRQATEHPAPPTPESKKLYAQANQAAAAVKADQERIDQLQKQIAGAKDERVRSSLQQQIDLTKAQLELDQDELEDVKGDLIRSGADRLSRIQRQFNRHEATQKEYETNNPQTSTVATATPQPVHPRRWLSSPRGIALRGKTTRLQQALDEAKQAGNKLAAKPRRAASPGGHGSLEQGGDCAAGQERNRSDRGRRCWCCRPHRPGNLHPAPDLRGPERPQRSRQTHPGPGRSGHRVRQLD